MAELGQKLSKPVDEFSGEEPLDHSSVGAPRALGHRSLKRLIDFLFLPSTHVMPNERVFAETLLLRDWDGMPENVLERLAARLSNAVEVAPRLALKLARCGRTNISQPLIHFGTLHDVDLIEIAHKGSEEEKLIIAGRRHLSPVVSDLLVDIGSDDVVKAVLLNTGAKISTRTLAGLILKSKEKISLQNAILFRPEMSASEAMELFWHVPGQIREYILLTYLCDQRSISGILDDDSAWVEHQSTLCSADISDDRIKAIAKLMVNDECENAINQLTGIARLSGVIAARILNDKSGEAFMVVAKAMGASRAGANEALMRLANTKPSIIGTTERLEPLRGLFDRLSRDQALVALQYWNCHREGC